MQLIKQFHRPLTVSESRDTGMAMVLLCLLAYFFARRSVFLTAAIILHVTTMSIPRLFKPVAYLWFGLSHFLSTIVSTALLSLAFLAVVVPVAILRRALGKDSLNLGAFNKNDGSTMVSRNHKFAPRDLERPY